MVGPSAAAMRATEALFGGTTAGLDREWMAKRAAVIDRETGLPELLAALQASDTALSEAREMLGVLEDHGGHDGLGGKGYAATIDHMDAARKANRAFIGVA